MSERGSTLGSHRLEIVLAEDRHAPELAEFFRQVWSPLATKESVLAARGEAAAANVAEPGVAPPTWIALGGNRVLGYVTTIPIRIWDGRDDRPAYWIKGLMVLPEVRNGPIGYAILKAAVARLPRTGALAAAAPALRLFTALGYSDLGPIPNWILAVAPHRVLKRLNLTGLGLARVPRWAPSALRFGQTTGLATAMGWTGGVVMGAARAALRAPGRGLRAGPFDAAAAGAELDALWRLVRDGTPTAVVRDARYLLQRYEPGAASPYEWVAVHRNGDLAGVAVLRRPRVDSDARLSGIRVAVLADLLYDPRRPGTGLALLGAIERAARRLDADAILASCSTPALARLLRSQLYWALPGNVHFLFRDVSGEPAPVGRSLEDWWLTRGDGHSDESF